MSSLIRFSGVRRLARDGELDLMPGSMGSGMRRLFGEAQPAQARESARRRVRARRASGESPLAGAVQSPSRLLMPLLMLSIPITSLSR
jgi:hypothetical protein